MSLDKFLLDQQIVDRARQLVRILNRYNMAKKKLFEANKANACTVNKLFPCRRRYSRLSLNWCDICKIIGPLEAIEEDSRYDVTLEHKKLIKIVEIRERVFPQKFKNGR